MSITEEELRAYLEDGNEGAYSGRIEDSGTGEVRRVTWAQHYAHLEESWEAGQHCSIFASADGGKTHLIKHLLPLWQRYPVLFLKNKPKDATLGRLGRRVRQFPTWDDRMRYTIRRRSGHTDEASWASDPEWFVLELPRYRWTPKGRRNPGYELAQRLAGEAIDKAYNEGEWVLVFDEVKVLAGREEPHLNVPAPMVIAWEQGRSQPLTVIAGTQSPSLAPPPMYDQARHIYLGRIQDTYRQERLAEIGGDVKRIRAVLPTLRGREFLYVFVGRADGEADRMWVVTAPPA